MTGGSELLAALGGMAALAVSLCVLVGIAVRLVLLPWLRTHLAEPMAETKRQVTMNGHTSPTPTMLDKLDTLTTEVGELRGDVAASARMYEGHVTSSEDELGRLWSAIKDLQRKGTP